MSKEINTTEENKQKGSHIINFEKFNQAVLFDGIGKGQFRPTDYDAVLEVNNKYWFAFEVKGKGKQMPYGQSLSYTRTADRWNKCGDIGIVFVVEHEETDTSKPIMLEDCILERSYMNGRWIIQPKERQLTVKKLIQILANKYNISKLKK